MGQSVDKYDIPQIQQQLHQQNTRKCREIIEEMNVKVPIEDAAAKSKLNQQQKQAFNTILQSGQSVKIFILEMAPGNRKTFLYRITANVKIAYDSIGLSNQSK
ncbi:hypothetical protein H5410_012877 [Solanum commersonii]|uniref:Uncharacterized protein n=1 Tax=Solanum commersonii TaxID=4109 RepID=A0A9J6ATN9_SOLCO|nr:hypothetical protein H5410_012877 [Solanum commersonii]